MPRSEDDHPGPAKLSKDPDGRLKRELIRRLWDSINNRAVYEVERIFEEGMGLNIDLRARNGQGRTLLSFAIWREDSDIVDALLCGGVDPNLVDIDGDTPLHAAIKGSFHGENIRTNIVSLLLQGQADINAVDTSNETPLMIAIKDNRLEIVNLLLQVRIDAEVDTANHNGRTALHYACAKGLEQVVDKLLAKGALVDAQDDEKRTPIWDGVLNSHVEVVERLIAAEASTTTRDVMSKTLLHEACTTGNVKLVELLCDRGALVDSKDAAGKTPLHFASARGDFQIVEALLARGARINVVSSDGSTPFHEALKHGAAHVAERLLEDDRANTIAKNTHKDGEIRTLEPFWNDLLHLPHAAHGKILMEMSASVPLDKTEERRICESFEGTVWPWPPEPFMIATPTVQGLLRGTPSLLAKAGEKTGATWIHIPANNRDWVEGVFKSIYGATETEDETTSPEPTTPNTKPKYDPKMRKLSAIIDFIRDEFSDSPTKTPRPIEMVRETKRRYSRRVVKKRRFRDQMIAVALPVIDIDLRQPYYDSKKGKTTRDKLSVNAMEVETRKANDKRKSSHNNSSYLLNEKIKQYAMDEGASLMEAEAKYVELMRKLESIYGYIDAPSSLDKYFHESIDDVDLNTRNGDQVISRFIARQQVRWEDERGIIGNLKSESLNSSGTGVPNTPSQLEAGQGNFSQPSVRPTAQPERFCQRILTVPRFWIWMVDKSTIVTSFPQFREEEDRQSLLSRAIWKRLMEAFLKKQQAAGQYTVHFDVDDMLEEIVRACLQFRPSFRLLDKEYSFPDVFASEIAFVSREVTMFYEAYRSSLGSSVEDYSESIKLTTECLIKVDDILNEMSMIRRVYRDQGRIMLNLRTNEEIEEFEGGSIGYNTSEWGYEGMRSTEDKYIIARLKHLEKDARMVRASIITLLDLRQRQVTVEMALSSEAQSRTLFRQSSILFIFALATVLITPLSWVSSLMALRIDGFSPDTWPQSRVVAASFGSVLGTVIFCRFGLEVYRRHQDHLMG